MSAEFLPVWFIQGGWVLWVLAGVSVFSIASIAYVSMRLGAARLSLTGDDLDGLVGLAKEKHGSGARRPYAQIAQSAGAMAAKGLPAEQAQLELISQSAQHLDGLRSGLRMLEVIAAAAPLMGLLGTVLGMIDAFKQLELAGNQIDPSLLSGGIWKALLTTAAGLIVALPALVAWHIFDRQLENVRIRMNLLISRLMTSLYG